MSALNAPSAAEASWPAGWMPIDFGTALRERVAALMSARAGGISLPPYASCNLGDHVLDDPEAVAHNRAVLARLLGGSPVWLTQVHGNHVVRLTQAGLAGMLARQPQADGAITTEPGLGCTVMVADCLPVLLAAPEGRGVGALHAGWRGLAGAGEMGGQGIVHTGVQALCEATSCDPADLRAWLGPCIGPSHFEVGADVLLGFGADPGDTRRSGVNAHFTPLPAVSAAQSASPKWLADLPGLARDILASLGVNQVHGGDACTVSDASRFFSFRRDRVTGRQAASICLRR